MASTAISNGHGSVVAQTISSEEKRGRIVEALRSDRQVVEDAVWLAGLPLVYEDEHRIYVHAGLRPGVAQNEQGSFDLLWIREPFLRSPLSFGKLLAYGHTPTMNDQPDVWSNRVGLDTGAHASNELTAGVFRAGKAAPVAFCHS